MSARTSWISGIGLLLACVAFSGLSIPLATVENGVSELSSDRSRIVAVRALQMGEIMMDHPFQKLVYPAARIESVRYRPGHCPRGEPGARRADADWVVDVRYYTFFAIPGPRVRVRCGGSSAIRG